MEVELLTEGTSEDENYILDDQIEDYLDIEGERCGICMEIVIDRGVLDCCQHWFCFACIDNWASITSLCPLCQNEFQLITCVPVYDTVGGSKTDEDTNPREDDWFVEGESNSLSFPSYYIDENAVVCLDGDGCKIRSGSVAVEEDSDIDTSIACDSCDKWYHAFCVAFDPDGTCDSSWLCPRCLADKVSNNLELGSVAMQSYQHGLEVASTSGSRMEDSFSGRVSVSLADDGETAVVVSLIEGHQKSRESSDSILDFSNDMNSTFWPSSTSYMPELEASLNTMISVDVQDNEMAKDHTSEFVEPNIITIECTTTADKISPDNMEVIASPPDDKEPATMTIRSPKRKQGESRNMDAGELQADNEAVPSQKKIKAGKNTDVNSLKGQTLESISEDSRTVTSRIISKDNKLKRVPEKKNATVDIMAIVKGTDRRSLKQRPSKTSSDATSKEKETAAGLRLKKIMRRADDNKSSAMQVQELREKIRDAVRNKSSKEIRENHFDPKLLDAFRAALAGSGTENRKPALDLKAKRSMLQKGKVRESLTKKIYGAGGKRKRAWSRECEVEFWKHRCQKVSRPEKVETLKSVLDLLRDDSADNMKKLPEDGEQRGSVLSRLYLADNSLLPRKNDVGPISSTSNATTTSELKRGNASIGNSSLPLLGFSNVIQLNNNIPNKVSVPPIDSKGVNKSINGKKLASEKEVVNKSDTSKGDKRKWAMELLARKTAGLSKTGQEDKKDNEVLKGNYPLLAQLQKDMRPVLAPSRVNKIPVPVRQAQLNRLTEHFLKRANLSTINRTAEIELAVADAVNIEKEIADKSKSKLVYVNLCSQELSRRYDNTNSLRSTESNVSSTSESLDDEISKEENNISDSSVDEALRNAGLLSDSPPDSPNHEIDGVDTEVGSREPDNVLEVDTLPELDIYGDFEYNLEDDDFLGVGNVEMISKPQPEEPKIKMVFSSFIPEKPDETVIEGSSEEGKTSQDCVVQIPAVDGDEELSIAECEELYGPEKEPLIVKYPEIASITLETLSKELPSIQNVKKENEKEKISRSDAKHLENKDTVMKKVEAYIKEHLRPLCKSGVITVDQYRWAVGKTTEKVMKYHSKEKSASFLIKEGEKVKKLAEQYVEAAPNKPKK